MAPDRMAWARALVDRLGRQEDPRA